MTISAKIIADSITTQGQRLTTFQVRYPRFIHSEVMTHRVFSRNASSSRAIPVKKVIADIRQDPAFPIHWGQNQPGMQANAELTGWKRWAVEKLWTTGMYAMTGIASLADRCGAHKQIVNRLIEPWSHINVVITATQFSNFFALRSHPDAQPEIKALSDAMRIAFDASVPKLLEEGEWHLPYIRPDDWVAARERIAADPVISMRTMSEDDMDMFINDPVYLLLIGVSVARCARTSYLLHDGSKTTFEKDLQLYERLLGSEPLHASPAEHLATPDPDYDCPNLQGNFSGWVQYRKLLPGECQ